MGALYSMSGDRYEWTLSIQTDGTYRLVVESSGQPPENESGTWSTSAKEDVLTFSPDGDSTEPHHWSIKDITQCERANTLLVLRRLIVASRNLPIVLYRVHHKPFDA